MAKQRFINTRFWSDSFIAALAPFERYLFLYFLTNEHTSICGIYELPLRTIAFETGVREKHIVQIIERLNGKIYYIDGWVFIRNFERHQFARGNSKVIIGIANEKKSIPKEIIARIEEITSIKIKTDTPSKGHAGDMEGTSTLEPDSDSDFEQEPDSESERDWIPPHADAPIQTATNFFRDPVQQESLVTQIAEFKSLPLDPLRAEIRKFVSYWTERNSFGTKQRWELEPTFEVYRRLSGWLEKAGKFEALGMSKGANIV
ncbi:MAG: hypothetical protein ABIB04_03325 [Patescibacteria group bacterium]